MKNERAAKEVKEEKDEGNLGILENFDKKNLTKPTIVTNKSNILEI